MNKTINYDEAYRRAILIARRLKIDSNVAFKKYLPRIIKKMEMDLERRCVE